MKIATVFYNGIAITSPKDDVREIFRFMEVLKVLYSPPMLVIETLGTLKIATSSSRKGFNEAPANKVQSLECFP